MQNLFDGRKDGPYTGSTDAVRETLLRRVWSPTQGMDFSSGSDSGVEGVFFSSVGRLFDIVIMMKGHVGGGSGSGGFKASALR
jgi:hypothetical protein